MVSSLDNDILTMTATTPMATPDTIPWFSSMVSTIFVKQPSKAYLNNVMICLNVLFRTLLMMKRSCRTYHPRLVLLEWSFGRPERYLLSKWTFSRNKCSQALDAALHAHLLAGGICCLPGATRSLLLPLATSLWNLGKDSGSKVPLEQRARGLSKVTW